MLKNQNWLDDLKAKYPSMKLSAGTQSAGGAKREPRDVLISLIENSMAVLANPAHTISKRGKTYKPETCFRLMGDEAELTLTYCRAKLTFPDGNKAITVPASDLSALLVDLKSITASKVFDDQLELIKSSRIAALSKSDKLGKGKKKAA